MLTFLPRLTAWGSSQRGRTLQPLFAEGSQRDLREETLNYERDITIDITRTEKKRKKKKKPRRKRISYWSDEEVIAIKPSRFSN